MAMGQFLMFASGSLYESPETASLIMYTGLAFLIFGNGFFKPNISTMVGQLYPPGDKRVDSAFTIFYMGINLGAFIAPLICGGLGETGNPADFKWGFLAAGCGMVLSVILFIWLKNYYIITPDGKQIGVTPNISRETKEIDTAPEVKSEYTSKQIGTWLVVFAALFGVSFYTEMFDAIGSFIFGLTVAAPGFIISDGTLTKVERDRIWVIYIVAFFVIFFWSAFEQAGASLTYFAEEQTERNVGWEIPQNIAFALLGIVSFVLLWLLNKVRMGMKNEKAGVQPLFYVLLLGGLATCLWLAFTKTPSEGWIIAKIPSSYFQTINAVAIVIFAPFFAMMWTGLGRKNMEPASPYKQSIGLFLLAVGYLVIATGVQHLEPGVKVTMLWLVSLYIIHTFGELCLSPIGLSMVNKLAPVKFASLLMGVWFLSTSLANKFAGTLSALYPEDVKIEKTVDTDANNSIYASLSMFMIDTNTWKKDLKLSTALQTGIISKMKKTNAEKDSITGLSPTGSTLEVSNYLLSVIKSTNGQIDRAVVSSDGKYLFTHDSVEVKQNGTLVKIEKLQAWDLKPEKPNFMGFKINDLYDFFMIFVFMAGAASVVLFILSKRMLKMMHGIR